MINKKVKVGGSSWLEEIRNQRDNSVRKKKQKFIIRITFITSFHCITLFHVGMLELQIQSTNHFVNLKKKRNLTKLTLHYQKIKPNLTSAEKNLFPVSVSRSIVGSLSILQTTAALSLTRVSLQNTNSHYL